MGPAGSVLHPLVVEVAGRQLATLRLIYLALAGLLAAIVSVSLALGQPLGPAELDGLAWVHWSLAGLSGLLLGGLLPLVRRRLLDPGRLQEVAAEELVKLGLPAEVDPRIGRQALYLTRYTAGCVVGWGLCAAVGLYGLVARMLGAGPLLSGATFAAAAFALVLLPPQRARVDAALRSFLAPPPGPG